MKPTEKIPNVSEHPSPTENGKKSSGTTRFKDPVGKGEKVGNPSHSGYEEDQPKQKT